MANTLSSLVKVGSLMANQMMMPVCSNYDLELMANARSFVVEVGSLTTNKNEDV